MNKKKKRLVTAVVVLAALLILAGAELIYSNYALSVSRYTVRSEKAAGSLRVVFISDLHGKQFGKDNSRLIKKMEALEPDLIAFVGDLIDTDADEDEVDGMLGLITSAAGIAPVYFSMGNHEYNYMNKYDPSLAEKIAGAGATVLDGCFVDTEMNGLQIRIGGYEGYYRTAHLNTLDKEQQRQDWRFFEEFENTDRYKILLNHIPTNWLDWNYRDKYPVDLVLSGHYHGGVVRIPILEQGLYVPYVGKLPPYTKGCFEGEQATCILSTGMAGAHGVPRVFNPPEIVVVEVVPAE